jgi:hypothetical protein
MVAMVMRESLSKPGEPSLDLTTPFDSLPLAVDKVLTPAGVFGGQQLAQRSSHAFRPDPSAVDLLDRIGVGEDNAASALGTDSFFALLAAEAPAWE